MNKIKEWFLGFFAIGIYIWLWVIIAACIFMPIVLGTVCSGWWFLSWLITIPVAFSIIVVLGTGEGGSR